MCLSVTVFPFLSLCNRMCCPSPAMIGNMCHVVKTLSERAASLCGPSNSLLSLSSQALPQLPPSSNSQGWPCCLLRADWRSRFPARHFAHVTLSPWVISLVAAFSWQSPRVRIPAEDLLSVTTRHQLPSPTAPQQLRLHGLSLWTRCTKGGTGEHTCD